MTIGELLQLAKTNLIEDAYYAVEDCLMSTKTRLKNNIVTEQIKKEVANAIAEYDYEWSDLVFVDNIKLNESFLPKTKTKALQNAIAELSLVKNPSQAQLKRKEEIRQELVSRGLTFYNTPTIATVKESVIKKLKTEGRYFKEKDNINNLVLKEFKLLKEEKQKKQLVANKMRGNKKQLKEAPKVTKTQLFQALDKKNISGAQLKDLDSMVKLVDTVLDKEFDTVADNTQELVKEYMNKKGILKEGVSYAELQKGETYTWTGGAEYANIKYIGKTSENPEAKIGSSMGKGLLFQWSDGKYFELSPNAVRKYVNKKDLEESKRLQESGGHASIHGLTAFHGGPHSSGRPDFNKMSVKEIEDYLEKDQVESNSFSLWGRSLSIVKSILDRKRKEEEIDKVKRVIKEGIGMFNESKRMIKTKRPLKESQQPIRKFKAVVTTNEVSLDTPGVHTYFGSSTSLGTFFAKLNEKIDYLSNSEEVKTMSDAEVISLIDEDNGEDKDFITIYEIKEGREELLIGFEGSNNSERNLDETRRLKKRPLKEAIKKTLPHRAAYAARNATRGDKYVLTLFGVHTQDEYDDEQGITFAKSLEEAANKIDLLNPREEYVTANNMMYCELDEHYEYLFLCKETDIDQAHSEWLELSGWGMDDEDEDELDEAVTVPLKVLEKGIDKISNIAEKTNVVITENKQNKMKTKEQRIKSLTEAIQKMTGKKVLLKEYPNAIADKVVRSKHIDPLTKSRYAMSKAEQGPSDSELEDFDLDNLDLDDDFGTEDTMFFDESTGSASAKKAAGKPRLQEGKEPNTTKQARRDAKNFHEDLISKYGFEKVFAALENAYENAYEGAGKPGVLNIADFYKSDKQDLIDYIEEEEEEENKRVITEGKGQRIKALTEAIQRKTGKKVILAEKKKDVIKTLKEDIVKRAKLVYYIKTGKKVTLKETAGEEGTTLEDQVNLENNIDTPTLGNIMPTSIIKTIEQYVSTTLAEIDKSTTELRTIKKNIVLNSGPSDGSFETLINRIGFLLKQLERVQRYTSNTIKAGVFNKSILDKIFEQKELLNEIK